MNLLEYCGSNPINMVDPFGLKAKKEELERLQWLKQAMAVQFRMGGDKSFSSAIRARAQLNWEMFERERVEIENRILNRKDGLDDWTLKKKSDLKSEEEAYWKGFYGSLISVRSAKIIGVEIVLFYTGGKLIAFGGRLTKAVWGSNKVVRGIKGVEETAEHADDIVDAGKALNKIVEETIEHGDDIIKGSSKHIDDLLSGLEKGSSSKIKTVKTEDELVRLFDKFTVGGKDVTPKNFTKGKIFELPDGTTIALRDSSKSGGMTIDIKYIDKRVRKVHIE